MVLAFWQDANLLADMVNDIVKMIPKWNDLLEVLDNWHNLTMMTTTYKIISKLSTERFKPIISKVVDKLQTGFVQDGCINDNIMAFKLAQEHDTATKQDVVLMKLDFEKTFDEVDHEFLWATLSAMNLDPRVITLIQGLVCNAKAKVHVNGIFT